MSSETAKQSSAARNKAYIKEHRQWYREYQSNYYRQKRYGITKEQFLSMVADQHGRCRICGTSNPGQRGWHIDHDHSTGMIRSLLCVGCNTGLGGFKDNPLVLKEAAKYLEQFHALQLSEAGGFQQENEQCQMK